MSVSSPARTAKSGSASPTLSLPPNPLLALGKEKGLCFASHLI